MTHYSKDGGEKVEMPLSMFQMPSERIGGDIEVLFNTNDETWFQKDYSDANTLGEQTNSWQDMFWRRILGMFREVDANGNDNHIPALLRQVDTDGNDVCGINSKGNLYCKDNLQNTDWKLIYQNGGFNHVTVSNGKLCIQNGANHIWCKDNVKPGGGLFRLNGPALKQVDLDGNQICGTGTNGEIYCKEDITKNNNDANDWKRIPGSLKHVSLSNGKLYGTNANDDIYYKENTNANVDWKQIRGKLKQVDMEGNVVCGVNSSNHIYCKDNLEDSRWNRVPGNLTYISVNDDTNFYGIGGHDIWYGSLNDK